MKKNKSGSGTFIELTLDKLDWLSIGLATWFLIYPVPYEILLGVLLFIPILVLVLNGLNKPSIASVSGSPYLGYRFTVYAPSIIAFVIYLRALVFNEFEFESFYSMIIPGTIAFAIILLFLFSTYKRIDKSKSKWYKWRIYANLIFFMGLYSYAGTCAANCAYDYAQPKVYKTEVLNKRADLWKHNNYYLEVAPWGHHYVKEEIEVSLSQYNETIVGDTVSIGLKEGLFNIPWYFIETKKIWE